VGAKLDIGRAGGLTMVELVVVVAIIAIMAGIAIPSMARMGLLWRNDLQASARELYTLLRAARIYASTYNVETAVVYSTYNPEGNTPNNLRAAALMYQHPTLTVGGESRQLLFVPVASRDEGQLRPLPGNTGLESEMFPQDKPGFEKVKVLFTNSTTYPEWLASPDEQGDYYANVFEPSGRLRNGERELYRLHVCYTADAGIDERLVDPELGENGYNLRTININIYRATGRVEIASD